MFYRLPQSLHGKWAGLAGLLEAGMKRSLLLFKIQSSLEKQEAKCMQAFPGVLGWW